MSLFHTHAFIQSTNPEVLYCICGKTKDIHQHKWIKYSDLARMDHTNSSVGYVLKCEVCGTMKNHYIDD